MSIGIFLDKYPFFGYTTDKSLSQLVQLKPSSKSDIKMHSVFWEEDENNVLFKLPLASGTKQEGVKVAIEDRKLSITSKAATCDLSHLSSSPFMISEVPASGTSDMNFNLPVGLNPDILETSVDETGILTVRFKKRMPINSKPSCSTVKSSCDMAPMGWFEPDDKEGKGVIHFKAGLSPEMTKEDLVVGIIDRQFLIIGHRLNERKEGGSCESFVLPHGVNPDGFDISVDQPGVLTVTFKKKAATEDNKKKKTKILKSRLLGGLAEACLLTGCKFACDELTGDDS